MTAPHETDTVTEAYERRAAEYSALFGAVEAAHPLDRQIVASWADEVRGPVIDAGCGPGHWTAHLADRGLTARGVDRVPAFVERARRSYPGVPFALGDLESLDTPDASLGGVLAWYSLIHHEPAAIGEPLREFARALRPGGTLLVGFFEWPALEGFAHAVAPAHRWPVPALAAELEAAGFDVLESHVRSTAGERPQAALTGRRRG